MKRTPILEPKYQGCANCSILPKTTLKDTDKIKDYDFISLCINEMCVHVEDITIGEFLKQNNITNFATVKKQRLIKPFK